MNKELVLVTGGSGFVGSYCILELLRQGYRVRTTLRSLQKVEEVKAMLSRGGATNLEELSFVAADLSQDEGWEEAVRDCTYVLHVASPFPIQSPQDENELIIPAREGTLRVLKAASQMGVARVVLTSSFAAIGYSIDPKGHVFTEADWTDPEQTKDAYIKSKTLAERAAWDFVKDQDLELTVINPVGIFGPALTRDSSASLSFVDLILTGQITESLPFSFGVVDVRDVAELHVKAMTLPQAKGERFLATADGVMNVYTIAQLIRERKPKLATQVSKLKPVDLLLQLSNEKAKTVLHWNPRSKEDAILASVESLLDLATVSKDKG